MRWVMYCLCVSLIVCAEDKKQPRPRQVQPHFVGSGRPKDQMTKKKSRSEKWFSSKTSLKKRKKKEIVQTEDQKKRPFYQKT